MSSINDFYALVEEKKKKRFGNVLSDTVNNSSDNIAVTTRTGNSLDDFFSLVEQKRQNYFGDSVLQTKSRIKIDDEEDIAPVKTENESLLDFFQKGSFEDGFDWSDIPSAILGTVGDVGLNVVKGVAGLGEGLGDLVGYGIAGVADKMGHDRWADEARKRTQESVVDDLTKGADTFLDQYSVLGRTSDAAMEGVGQVGAILATGGLAGAAGLGATGTSVLTTGIMGASGMGSGMSEAYQAGATDEEALTYGAIAGVADAVSKMIFGGLGKSVNALGLNVGLSSADGMLAKKVSGMFKKQIAKNFAELCIKAGSEGFEEVLSGVAQGIGKYITYGDDDENKWDLLRDEDFWNILRDENLLEQFVVGAVTSGLAQTADVIKSNKTGTDLVTGLTQNEQAVIDKEYSNRLAELEKNGKVSGREKTKLYDRVVEDMDKGYISIDTIEEVLGGDNYKAYKDVVDSETALDEELKKYTEESKQLEGMVYEKMTGDQQLRRDELRKLIPELQSQVKANQESTTRKDLKKTLSDEVADLVKDSRLAESYRESARVYEKLDIDPDSFKDSKHADAAKKTIESAIALEANNTNRVRDLVENSAQIAAETGKAIIFKDNDTVKNAFVERQTRAIEKLEANRNRTAKEEKLLNEMKQKLEGVKSGKITVNGEFSEDGIVINIDSKKPIMQTVGHEITHNTEKAKSYDKMKKALFAYANTKGIDVQTRIDMAMLEYEGIENAVAEREVVADLVGEMLFTDDAFVEHLASTDTNVFQNLWNDIKNLVKMAIPGSKEAKELANLEHKFEKAFREANKAQKNTADQYSITDGTIINKLTGREIEQNTYAVLDRLENGENVTPEELANLKEVQEGKRRMDGLEQKFIDDHPEFMIVSRNNIGTYLLDTQDRINLRNRIINERMNEGSFSGIDKDGNEEYNGNVKKDRRIDIVVGLPASGKSTSIVNPLSQYYESAVIDSDMIKTRLPEFNGGWGASLVHEESSIINTELLGKTLADGYNIILPIVGAKISSVEKYIDLAKSEGYDVHIHLNELPNGKAVGRMLKRYFNQGRFINPSFALEYGNKPTFVYEQIIQRSDISGYSRWNNDVSRGQRPRQVDISENNRVYGEYSSSWRAGRGKDSGSADTRIESQTRTSVTPAELTSSKDGVFFDTQNRQYSLTEESFEVDGNTFKVVDGTAVSVETANVMQSPEYKKPTDYMTQYSVSTEPAWEKSYLEKNKGTEAEKVVFAVREFTDKMVQDDVIRGYVPMGDYKYSKFGPLRTNQEYVWTFDMDTSCPRTFQFLNFRDAIQRKAGRYLTYNESINLLELMRAYGQQIPCCYCYVENKRVLLSASYNNFFGFRDKVLKAATDEEAAKVMYGYDEKKGLPKASREAMARWRADVSYNPSLTEVWTATNTARNSVLNFLDSEKTAGRIDAKTAEAKLNRIVLDKFGITDKGAIVEIETFVKDWTYDTLANVPHIYNTDNDLDVSVVDERALALNHEALAYSKSASSAKSVENYVPYTDQLKNVSEEDREYIMGMGGIRKHSSNDFRMDYVQDYFMFYADLAAGKWTGHTYTKSTDFTKVFACTGDRINMSIAFYEDADGSLRPNTDEGAAWKDVQELRKAYKNVGSMAMVTSDAQLSYALNAGWIDMIIPFHASGLDKSVWYNLRMWNDYTSKQGERFFNADTMKQKLKDAGVEIPRGAKAADIKALYDETFQTKQIIGKKGEVVKPHFYPGDTYVNGQLVPGHHNNAETYFKLCEEYGVHPRFYGIKVTDTNGNEIDVTEHPSYIKLIKETSRIDTPQEAIQFNFGNYDPYLKMTPFEYAMNRLSEEAKNGGFENTKEDPYGVVQEFVDEYLDKDKPLGYLTERAKETRDILLEMSRENARQQNALVEKESQLSLSSSDAQPTAKGLTGKDFRVQQKVDDIAPVVETATPVENQKPAVQAKKVEQIENAEEAIASVLTEEPVVKKENGVMSWVRNNLLDKGMVFEKLSKKTNNRELEAKWNSIRYSNGKAQHLIGEGTNGVKSLNAIREQVEKTGKTKQFYEYLYHRHNVDRMSLEDKYQDVKNKPVFGSAVTADDSRATVRRLEMQYPKFKQFAQDVYDYMNFLRKEMVENGVISQELADLWSEMYPNYVPIRRSGDFGLAINVPLDSRRTGVNVPVKRATGGSSDILPLFDTMGQRTMQTYKAIAKNRFGIELKNTLGTEIQKDASNVDDVIENVDNPEELLKSSENGRSATFTVFENGEKVTFEITDEMYDAMKPASKTLSYTNKVTSTVSSIFRGLTTEYNPAFMLTNPIKDVQDVLMNSQHARKTYGAIPEAISEIANKGKWYQEYVANGGEQNSYFDSSSNTFVEEKKIPGLYQISKANNFIEMTPRLAEYIASRKEGRSIDVSMLDAARVTTNFAAGGDFTKFLNRNGATFLNASVQGAIQNVRNIQEAKMNGLKGAMGLAAKFVVAGLPMLLLNNLIWDDDEEYEELSDYVKQNYYLVGKFNDGQFVRIPKGRTVAVIQEAFNQMGNLITGDDEVDMKSFLDLLVSNLAPNNPLENNIFAPIAQVRNNKTWYGEDLVPTRLQDLPAAEQYDESTDSISKWLGETFNVSPYKVNYLLDQYTGGVGDTILPMMTPEAESGDDSLLGNLFAPIKSKFTTDSVMNNQNVADFYDLKDELTVNAKASTASDQDVLMSKYMNAKNAELSKLYAQKREYQNSGYPDSVKYKLVRKTQDQIVSITRDALEVYDNIEINGDVATVGDKYFKKNKSGEWEKMSDDEVTKRTVTGNAGDSLYASDGVNSYRWVENDGEGEWRKITFDQYKKQLKVSKELGISAEEYWNNKEEYDEAYENPETYALAKSVGGYKAYSTYNKQLNAIKADKDEWGQSISGSRKKKVKAYIDSLDISDIEKHILFKSEYPSTDTYNREIVEYLDSREDISWEEMKAILLKLDFKVSDDGKIRW